MNDVAGVLGLLGVGVLIGALVVEVTNARHAGESWREILRPTRPGRWEG